METVIPVSIFCMKKSLAFLVVGVAIVLSFVFATYLVFMQFRPEREIRSMMITMANQSAMLQDAGFSWVQQDGENRVSTTVYSSGVAQVTQAPLINHSTSFRVVYLSEDDSYQDISGELRSIEGRSYLTYASPGPDVPGVNFKKTTWVEFSPGEISSWGPILPGLNAPLESVLSQGVWTSEGLERLRFLLSYADILHVEYNGLTEQIDGIETRVIDGQFDPDAINAFLLDLVRAKEGRQPNDDERILASVQARQLARLTIRFWIGISDHYLYRIQAAGGFEDSQSTDLIPVDARIEFRIPKEAILVKAPKKTISFESIFHAVLGIVPALGTDVGLRVTTLVTEQSTKLPVTKSESTNDTDGDGLDTILEAFYGTSGSIADTDGDGMNDGDEVRSGRNPRGTGSLFGFGF